MPWKSLHDKPLVKCKICGKEFVQNRKGKLCCSVECSKENHRIYHCNRKIPKELKNQYKRTFYAKHRTAFQEKNHQAYLQRIANDPDYYKRRRASSCKDH